MNTKKRFIFDDFRISQESINYGWTMPYSHCHVAYEIYILKSGERTVTIEDMEYTAKAMDATLFSSNTSHKSRGDTPFSGICIHFSERYIDLYFTTAAKKQLMKCFKHKVISLSDTDFETIQRISDNFKENASNNFLILAFILDILNRSVNSVDLGVSAGSEKKIKKSQRVIEYVNENYVYIKKISDITDIFNLSENYVFQIFRKNYSMTPKQYINKLRINNACHRLKYEKKSIKSIALDCGFDSYEHFINVFKKAVAVRQANIKKCFNGGCEITSIN
ncbi:AraC family transcriptional regulator [Firmicutes bacterium AM55-24TS]|nr:AraC family transcriptional regulator [Firmicutes bacterium AM55-24TS]RHP02622.1 AraC family transcriptional regulator [Firmicutes bacterium AF36-3BH]